MMEYLSVPVNAIALYVGQSTTLSAPSPPSGGAIHQTAWGCSNPNVTVTKYLTSGAKVTVNSYFTGTAEIRCDYYWHWYDRNGVMHTNNSFTYFYVTCNPVNLTMEPTSMTLSVGQGQTLSYSYSPSNVIPSPKLRFMSSNTSVATVNEIGYVKAIGSGNATITLENGSGPNATCYVTVKQSSPTGVSLPYSLSLIVGESKTLSPTVMPNGASTSFTWSTDDSNIASVSSYGRVTGIHVGTTKVWVTTTAGGFTDYCNVTVKEAPVVPTGISLPKSIEVYQGFGRTLVPELTPVNAETTYTWRSSDTSVVTVNSSGTFTAKKEGTATITVTTQNNLKATCEITVIKLPGNISETNVNSNMTVIDNLINKTFNKAY